MRTDKILVLDFKHEITWKFQLIRTQILNVRIMQLYNIKAVRIGVRPFIKT